MEAGEKLLSTKEAAKALKKHPETIKRWIQQGKIVSTKTLGLSGHHGIPQSEIDRYTQKHRGNESNPAHIAEVEQSTHRPPKILITEDNLEIRELLVFKLIQSGYEITTAGSIDEAWKLAQETNFDLYLIDNKVPITDVWEWDAFTGIELCKRIRERDPVTPIIFFSGFNDKERIKEAIDAGAQDYLKKPDDIDRLFEVIKRWVQNVDELDKPSTFK